MDGFLDPYLSYTTRSQSKHSVLPFHHQTISSPVPWGRASSQELVRLWLHRNYSDEAKNKVDHLISIHS